MSEIITEAAEKESKNAVWDRKEVAENISSYERKAKQGLSQRQLAEEMKIPRTTLQHWLQRKESLSANKEVGKFFESSEGLAMLHQIAIAAQFVMTEVGPCGIRLVCLFFELSGLGEFIGSSYGCQQQVSVAMEKAIVEFGELERKRPRHPPATFF